MKNMRTRPALVAGVLALAALAVAAPAAHADTVNCSVVEIEASTSEPPAVDAALKPLQKKLKKPPFSSWNSFKQLGSQSLVLETMKASTATLVHGKATLLLREVTGEPGKRQRLAFTISVDDGAGKRVLDSKVTVDVKDTFVVGRSLPAGKGHLVALTCKQP
jgi:hypothetical protein